MDRNTLQIIRNNPYIYSFLREYSSHYKYLYSNPNYIKEIEKLAKEKYKIRFIDKVERLGNNLELIKTFLDVL